MPACKRLACRGHRRLGLGSADIVGGIVIRRVALPLQRQNMSRDIAKGECYLEIDRLALGKNSDGRSSGIGIGGDMPIFLAHDHHHAWSEAVLHGQVLTSPGYGESQAVYLKVALSNV